MLLLKPSILMCCCDINVLPTVGREWSVPDQGNSWFSLFLNDKFLALKAFK